ncbi:MAG: Uma2 family endonuclease [Rhodopirellula sp.]|nr:Uma2 family endonuclease [Rhodopirellula sp.]
MAQTTEFVANPWTAVDLANRFGPIPLNRVRFDPPPGKATERDLLAICEREERLYELVDGVLLEKVMGWNESCLAVVLIEFLQRHVRTNGLGVVAGPDGLIRLVPGLIRIPDISFISWQRLPGGERPRVRVASWAPDLAVEFLSEGSTAEEMDRKLHDYFEAGVRLVWYIDPAEESVRVYHSPQQCTRLGRDAMLDGGDVLPGFRLSLEQLFTLPTRPSA